MTNLKTLDVFAREILEELNKYKCAEHKKLKSLLEAVINEDE